MRSTFIVGGSIVAAVVGLVIFGGLSGSKTSATGAAAVYDGAPGTNLAPDVVFQKLGGGTVSLASFRGQKPVVVDFLGFVVPELQTERPRAQSVVRGI